MFATSSQALDAAMVDRNSLPYLGAEDTSTLLPSFPANGQPLSPRDHGHRRRVTPSPAHNLHQRDYMGDALSNVQGPSHTALPHDAHEHSRVAASPTKRKRTTTKQAPTRAVGHAKRSTSRGTLVPAHACARCVGLRIECLITYVGGACNHCRRRGRKCELVEQEGKYDARRGKRGKGLH